MHALIHPRNHQVGTLLKRHMLVPSPTAPQHTVAWNHRGRGNSLNATSANFSVRRTVLPNLGTWRLPYVYHCAKNSAGFPNSCWNSDTINRKLHMVLVLFRPLPNMGMQNFGMWGMYNLAKAYRSIKKSIANRRVEDWEASNGHTKHSTRLFHGPWHDPVGEHKVRSHLGCGTHFVFICLWKSHKYFKDPKVMQINRVLKIS